MRYNIIMIKMKFTKKRSDLAKPVTLGLLLEYTDDFLLPKISDLMDERIKINNVKLEHKFETLEHKFETLEHKISQTEHNLKVYIDDKLADYTSDIFKRLDKKYQHDKKFKEKLVELLKKHHIGTEVDLAYLEGLVN